MQRARSGSRKREVAFGQVLQQIRKERSLSQEQLGFDSGYHRTYISFLECGKKSPSLSTIMDLAETLKISAAELIGSVETLLKRRDRKL